MLKTAVSSRFLPLTLLIIALCALFIRLGFWQLSRLEWRRGLNADLTAQLAQPPVSLSDLDLTDPTIENRAVTATCTLTPDPQLILLNQINDIASGVRLITPCFLDAETAVLVDRGWISISEYEAIGLETANLEPYAESFSTIQGRVRLADPPPRRNLPLPTPIPNQPLELFRLETAKLDDLLPYDLLPVILIQAPMGNDGASDRPYRPEPHFDLSEGSHLSYAVQWFAFTLIFGVGYIGYIRRQSVT